MFLSCCCCFAALLLPTAAAAAAAFTTGCYASAPEHKRQQKGAAAAAAGNNSTSSKQQQARQQFICCCKVLCKCFQYVFTPPQAWSEAYSRTVLKMSIHTYPCWLARSSCVPSRERRGGSVDRLFLCTAMERCFRCLLCSCSLNGGTQTARQPFQPALRMLSTFCHPEKLLSTAPRLILAVYSHMQK